MWKLAASTYLEPKNCLPESNFSRRQEIHSLIANIFVDKYRSPVSGRMTTMFLPANSGRAATCDAAQTAADTPDIAQLLVDKDAAFTVHKCLHALEEPYKEVFSLRVFGELPFDRIGAIFGHNAAWARVTYYRAKTKLQAMLQTT